MISLWQIILSVVFVLLTWMFNKVRTIYNRLNKKNTKTPDVSVLTKTIPLTRDAGWKVAVVRNSVPLWKYQTSFTFAPFNLYGCKTLLQSHAEPVFNELLNVKTFCSLFPGFLPLKLEKKNTNNNKSVGDVLSFSNINTSLSLTSIITSHHSIFTLERHWVDEGNTRCLYMLPSSSLLAQQYGYWMCFFVHELEHTANTCLLHVLASYPASTDFSYVSQTLSSCIVLMQDHISLLPVLKKGGSPSKDSIREAVSPSPSTNDSELQLSPDSTRTRTPTATPKKDSEHPKILGEEAFGMVEAPAVISRIRTPSEHRKLATTTSKTPHKRETDTKTITNDSRDAKNKGNDVTREEPQSKFSYDSELLPYASILEESYKTLMEIFLADANTPNWSDMGVKSGVHILKKEADELSASCTYKGTSTINVPLPYLLTYTSNLEYRREFDGLFEAGDDIVVFKDGVTKITNLRYQNVWPTTGRDFCSMTAVRHLKNNMYGCVVKAVVHPDCPEKQNKVRGEVLIAGYVFEELSIEPPSVRFTYITRAELKGSIPQRIINRVNAEQPLLAGNIKKHCERRYEIRDPDTDGMEIVNNIEAVPSVFEDPPPPKNTSNNEHDGDNDSIKADNQLDEKVMNDDVIITDDQSNAGTPENSQNPAGVVVTDRTTEGDSTNFMLSNGFDLRENSYSKDTENGDNGLKLPRRLTSDDSLFHDSESVGALSQFTEDQTQISICDQPLDLPRDACGKIDYITLGNQAAAALEEEFIMARSVTQSSSRGEVSNSGGDWVFQGVSKDIEILRKIQPGQKFHCFLGRGIIKTLPVTVWEAIKNPTTRFIYDNMLKRNDIVKELSDRHRILHLRHETTACFVKQARDFCLLTVERVESHLNDGRIHSAAEERKLRRNFKEQQRYAMVATSVDIPECPPVRDCVRGRILSSGWIVEPILYNGKYCSKVTYITQVDFGGRLPTRVINFVAKRQPLSLAYLRDFLESSEF